MKRVASLAFLAFACLCVVWWWQAGRRPFSNVVPGESPSPDQRGQPKDGQRFPEANAGAVRTRSDVDAVSPTQPHGPLILGRLMTGASGSPWPNGHVRIRWWSAEGDEPDLPDTTLLACDESGRFVWPLPQRDEAIRVRLCGEEPRSRAWPKDVLCFPGDLLSKDVELSLDPWDRTISGRVRTAAGVPIDGARVETTDNHIVAADHAGDYAIEVPSCRRSIDLIAWAPEYAESRAHVSMNKSTEGSVIQCDFVLGPTASIDGKVRDDRGSSIGSATISVSSSTRVRTTSGLDGTFRLEGLSANVEQSMCVRAKGYAGANVRVTPSCEGTHVDVVLNRGCRVAGTLSLPDGGPARGATVFVGASRFSYDRLDTWTHENGAFSFDAVPTGDFVLHATLRGYAEATCDIQIPRERESLTDIAMALGEGQSIAGAVVDEQNAPVEGAWVIVTDRSSLVGDAALSGKDGAFRCDDVPVGKHVITAGKEGFIRSQVEGVSGKGSSLRIILARSAQLRGLVIDAQSGEPIQEFTIRVDRKSMATGPSRIKTEWFDPGHEIRQSDGRWSIDDGEVLPGVTARISVMARGYKPATCVDAVFVTGEARDVVIRLDRGGHIEGAVIDSATQKPVAGAILRLTAITRADEAVNDLAGWESAGTTDENGAFWIDSLAGNYVRLLVESSQYISFISEPIQVPESVSVKFVRIMMRRACVIEGAIDVKRDNGGTYLQATPAATENGTTSPESISVSADGTFRSGPLPAGEWTVTLRGGFGGPVIISIEKHLSLRDGDVGWCDFRSSSLSTVRGTVRAAEGLPNSLDVSIRRQDSVDSARVGEVISTATASRTFEFRGVAAGQWNIEAHAIDSTGRRWSGRASVVVGPDRESSVELVVELDE
jgi:carboxypeptidase family protein